MSKPTEKTPSKPEKIRRTAQSGNVPFPRAVAYDPNLSLSAKSVALWLYDHLKPGTNIATGSQITIAEDLVLGERTVRQALDELWKNHIIMQIEKNNKLGGGYYLSYHMRIFPSGETRKPRPNYNQTPAKLNYQRRKKKPIPTPQTDCSLCYGTGWQITVNPRGAKPCACKEA